MTAQAELVHWETSLQQAKERTAREGKALLLDFSAAPDDGLVANFEYAHALSLKALDTIAASIDQAQARDIDSMRNDVMSLRTNFNDLVRDQNTLGLDDSAGLRGNLRRASNRPRWV